MNTDEETREMTDQEKALLAEHNGIFTKSAKTATIYNSYRFYVTYENGNCKHDYMCGSFSYELRKAAGLI